MRLRSKNPIILWLCVSVLASFVTRAEDIRDYYSEPGLQPFKSSTGQDDVEHIDPFSGTLQLRYTDVVIPGSGGLDIRIQRVYTNPQTRPAYDDTVGVGWTMHFGRIVVPYQYGNAICGTAGDTSNNPSIEHPDGRRELLALNSVENDGSLITKSNWRAECIDTDDPDAGMLVTAPDGTEYRMDELAAISGPDASVQSTWYTSQIKDLHNNSISIAYGTLNSGGNDGRKYITQVTSSDGRRVDYQYKDENNQTVSSNSLSARLTKVTAHPTSTLRQEWSYLYEPADAVTLIGGIQRYQLAEVVRPDGLKWEYEYNPEYTDGSAGSYSVNQVTYPHGGQIDYTYQKVNFYSSLGHQTHAIDTKTTSGPNITGGVWDYDFDPGSHSVTTASNGTRYMDKTTISVPDGSTHYFYHYGEKYANGLVDLRWAIGLLYSREVYEASQLLERELIEWNKREISDELFRQGEVWGEYDPVTYAPVLVKRTIDRDGTEGLSRAATQYSNFDEYGHPQTVDEVAAGSGELRTTQRTYFNNKSEWIIGLLEDETIVDEGTISRTFNTDGTLDTISRFGVATEYTYTSSGDMATEKDARQNTVTYQNHYRGIPRNESHPENVTISREVNTTGTVKSLTDGRGNKKSFLYDDLNRLRNIDFPENADVVVAWYKNGRRLERGNYEETVTLDGFGRERSLKRKDTSTGYTVTISKDYDVLGRQTLESYPTVAAYSIEGVRMQYDALGRVTRITHQDDTYLRYNYKSQNIVEKIDERGNSHEYTYRSFGDHGSDQTLIRVSSDVDGETQVTRINRNLLGQIQTVRQGQKDNDQILGWTRSYNYDPRKFLETEIHPETGTTVYGRDAVGNMTSRQVGNSGITNFIYDSLDRLETIDYPDDSGDVGFTFDKNGNIKTVSKGDSVWSYNYDKNNNLLNETLDLSYDHPGGLSYSQSYLFSYSYSDNDYLNTITYPSDTVVDYAPNALGRPTQVGSFVTSISYHPNGQIHNLTYGNGVTRTIAQIADRLFPDSIIDRKSGQDLVNLDYAYDDIGNIDSITDAVDSARSKSFGYDELNRLINASGQWGSGSMSYNHVGNIKSYQVGSSDLPMFYDESNRLHGAGVTNISSGGTIQNYDLSGVPIDSLVFPRHEFEYDVYGNINQYDHRSFAFGADGNLASVTNDNTSEQVAAYTYDGNNYRTTLAKSSALKFFAYNRAGKLLLDQDHVNLESTEYIYLQSQLIASRKQACDENLDTDSDGMTDCYESRNGLNPNDASDAAQDIDEDGLTNLQEFQAGTNPQSSDTDGDGIDDGVEVTNGLDPNNGDAQEDSDGDGYTNLQEAYGNSDPFDPDSLPDGAEISSLETNSFYAERIVFPALAPNGSAIYFTAQDGNLYARNSNGEGLWNYTIDANCDGSVAVATDGTIYAGCRNGRLFSLTPDGELNWELANGGLPAIGHNGRLYISRSSNTDGEVVALDTSGTVLWQHTVPFSVAPALTISDDNDVYVMEGSTINDYDYNDNKTASVRAIKADGSLAWHREIALQNNGFFPLGATMSLGIDGSLYFLAGPTQPDNYMSLVALNPDGSEKWQTCELTHINELFPYGTPNIDGDGNLIVHDTYYLTVISPDGKIQQRAPAETLEKQVIDGELVEPDQLDWFGNGTYYGGISIGNDGTYIDSDSSDGINIYDENLQHRAWVRADGGFSFFSFGVSSPVIPSAGSIGFIDANGNFKLLSVNDGASGIGGTAWATIGANQQRTFSRRACGITDSDEDGLPDCYETRVKMDPENAEDAMADSDGDGLTNLQEYVNGTHPRNTDSDGDGFSDAYEVSNQLNPMSSGLLDDPDGDGASSLVEFLAGTSPSDENSVPAKGQQLWAETIAMPIQHAITLGPDNKLYVKGGLSPNNNGQIGSSDDAPEALYQLDLFGSKVAIPDCPTSDVGVYGPENDVLNLNALDSASAVSLDDGRVIYTSRSPDQPNSTLNVYNKSQYTAVRGLNGYASSGMAVGYVTDEETQERTQQYVYFGTTVLAEDEEDPDEHRLVSFDVRFNNLRWQATLPAQLVTTPAVGPEGDIYSGTADGSVHKHDATGQLTWSTQLAAEVTSPIALSASESVLLGTADGTVYSISSDGVVEWSYATGGAIRGSAAIAADGRVFVTSTDGIVRALSSNGVALWEYDTGASIHSSVTLAENGELYFVASDGYLYALDATGELLWRESIGSDDAPQGSVVLTDTGELFVGSNDGKTYAFYAGSGGLADAPWPTHGSDNANTASLDPIAVVTDDEPPIWESLGPDGEPRVGVQAVEAVAGGLRVFWDEASDDQDVQYWVYLSEVPFDFSAAAPFENAQRILLQAQAADPASDYALEAVIDGLSADTDYHIVIHAEDASGNEDANHVTLSSAPLLNIVIDGSTEEWASVPTLIVDNADADDSAGADFLTVQVAHDEVNAYLYFTSENAFNLDGSPTYAFSRNLIFIDVDGDKNTGWPVGTAIGSEFVINGAHLYRQTATSFNDGFVATLTTASTSDSKGVELMLPLAHLEATYPDISALRFLLLNDETYDYAPDGGNTGVYYLGDVPPPTGDITIDGDLSDWSATAHIIDADDSGDSAGPDWRSLWMTEQDGDLMIALESDHSFSVDGSPEYQFSRLLMFFDTDNNPNTGYAINGIGSEFVINGGQLFAQAADQFNAGWIASVTVAPQVESSQFEFAVPLSVLQSDPSVPLDTIRFVALNDETSDYAPDLGQYYLFDTQTKSGEIVHSNPITVDGDFSDWANTPIALSDPLNDVSASAGPDWGDIKLKANDQNLYINATSGNTFNVDGSPTYAYSRLLIFIDVDSDPSTGYATNGIGSDLVINGTGAFTQAAGQFSVDYLGTVMMAPVSNVSQFEAEIPKAFLRQAANLASDADIGSIQVLFLNDEVSDYAPKIGSVLHFTVD